MLTTILTSLFERDLNKLVDEIKAYHNESDLWVIKDGISNSAGNLCLHLIGNLNHFIGAIVGNTGYVRDRPAEFSLKDVPRSELLNNIEKLKPIIANSLSKLSESDLEKPFPVKLGDVEYSTGFFLINMAGHLNYHLGQINYHRRLLGK